MSSTEFIVISDSDDDEVKAADDRAGKRVRDIEACHVEHLFSAEEAARVYDKLCRWFEHEHRVLPWRDLSSDGDVDRGYAVWVSEIMLQQTQVKTVIDYYRRWMARWPTVHDLAAATLDEVNEMWAGLGYYRRAKLLHDGAKLVATQHGGRLPRTAAELSRLPGVGAYTAGAIASLAYGQNAPLVDGNVARVLSRLRLLSVPVKQRSAAKFHWRLAEQLVAAGSRPGVFNQALMELGALVCLPKQPVRCADCPLQTDCLAYAESQQRLPLSSAADECPCCDRDYLLSCADDRSVARYPQPSSARPPRPLTTWLAVVRSADGRLLCVKRPADGLLGGLWELPQADLADDAEARSAGPRAVDDVLRQRCQLDLQRTPHARSYCGQLVHLFTHIRQTLLVESVRIDADQPLPADTAELRWVDAAELASVALSKGMLKCLQLVDGGGEKTKRLRTV